MEANLLDSLSTYSVHMEVLFVLQHSQTYNPNKLNSFRTD